MCHGLKPWSSLWVSNSLKPRIKNGRPVSGMLLCDTPHISPDVCKSIKGAVRGQAMTGTHLLKLAKFCITLAMSVSVRDVRSAGYSCIRLNREGDMMAGHMKRRNREELMRLSARSSLPRSAHLALHEAKTSFSSRGNMLRQEHDFIIQCQGEQRDKKKKKKRQPAGVLQGQETETYRKLLDHTPLREEKVLMKPALKPSYIMLMILPIISLGKKQLNRRVSCSNGVIFFFYLNIRVCKKKDFIFLFIWDELAAAVLVHS